MTKNTQAIVAIITTLKAHFTHKAEHAIRNAMPPNAHFWGQQKNHAQTLITALQKPTLPTLKQLPSIIKITDTLQATCQAHSKLSHITDDGRTYWRDTALLLANLHQTLKDRQTTRPSKTDIRSLKTIS